MSKRTIGLVLNLLGILTIVLALAADSLGLGAVAGIGWKQWTTALVGVVIALSGIWMTWVEAK